MMKISTLAAGVALSALLATGAVAADISNPSLKDDSNYASGAVMNWSGFYIGGSLGRGSANHKLSVHDYFKDYCGDAQEPDDHGFDDEDKSNRSEFLVKDKLTCNKLETNEGGDVTSWNDTPVSGDSREIGNLNGLSSAGLVGDGRVGYDRQLGRVVVGIYGAYGFSDMSTTASLAGTNLNLIEKGDEWSLGARAGLLVAPRTLAYILAAYTEQEWTYSGLGAGGSDKDVTFSGVTVGGGVEFALTSNVFLGIEGTHTFLGEETIADAYSKELNQGIAIKDEIGETKVMGTLKLKLNQDVFGGFGR